MRSTLARCSALGAFFVAAAVMLSACGGDSLPGNAIVKVGDTSITKATFNRWMTVAVKSQAQQSGASSTDAVAPVPPDYTACVAQLRKSIKPVKGQPTPTAAALKTECKSEYESFRDAILQQLITAYWYAGEGKDQGITITDKQVDQELAKRKKASFKTEAQYQKYLKSSGWTTADIKLQLRGGLYLSKLQDKIAKGSPIKVTDKQVHAYYVKHKSSYGQPERRDIRIVLTKAQDKAKQAKAALESGRSWNVVAKQYSTDQATKKSGGVILAVTKGSQEQALDSAVFAAKANELLGPIKTQFGYYVVEVTKISPATQQTEAQAKPAITTLLKNQQKDKVSTKFGQDFQKKWKAKTICRSGFNNLAQLCKNAPKSSATTGATTTG